MRGLKRASVVAMVVVIACSSGGEDTAGDVGKPCFRSSDCASGECIARIGETIAPDHPGICTKPCAADGDCVAGWRCLASPSGKDLCACGASKETCNGKDDDCNGVIDDAPGGICSCTKTICGTVCADLSTDSANCGSCSHACPSGAHCVQNACTCDGGKGVCPTGCTDFDNDANNCGACGRVCPKGAECVARTCRCGKTSSSPECTATVGPAPPEGPIPFCDGDRCNARETLLSSLYVTGAVATSDVVVFSTATGYSSYVQYVTVVDPWGGRKVTEAGQLNRPEIAASGPDVLINVSGYVPSDGRLMTCPNRVCGTVLVKNPVGPAALYGGYAYWITKDDIERCAVTGCNGAPEIVAANPQSATTRQLAVDASGIYAAAGTALWRFALGGAAEQLATIPAGSKIGLAASYVYVATTSGILQCAKTGCGGTPTVYANASIRGFVTDDTGVFWTTPGSSGAVVGCAAGPTCAAPHVYTYEDTDVVAVSPTRVYFGTPKGLASVTR